MFFLSCADIMVENRMIGAKSVDVTQHLYFLEPAGRWRMGWMASSVNERTTGSIWNVVPGTGTHVQRASLRV